MRKGFWLLCLPLIFCSAQVSEGFIINRDTIISSGRPVEVYAENISREMDLNKTIAEGAVEIRSGDLRLRADRVELNQQTMDLVATGNVLLEFGEDRLQGERIELNLNTELGHVIDGRGFSNAYYFSGKRIDKISEDRYKVSNGSFTSCEGVLPDWSFRSPDTLIHVEHYIYTHHPSLWVKKVPVFYIPYAILPIKRDRATGMLIPRIRYRKADGLIVNNSFFWAPVDNADATVYTDYYSKRGWRFGLEGRYVMSEETSGRMLTYYITDRITGSNRWDVEYLHKQALPWEVFGLVNFDFLSDRQYLQDFGEELDEVSEEKLESFASLSREWGNTTVILSGQHKESLTSTSKTTLTRLPELNIKKTGGNIMGGPFFWSMRTQAVDLKHKTIEETTQTQRLHVGPTFSLPLNIQSWATVNPSVALRYTYYAEDSNGEAADRFVYNPSLEVSGPKFYRIFGEQEAESRFKHLITPKLRYNYIPEVDQDNLPRFDSIDRISPDNSLTYSLTNQLLGKFTGPEEEVVIREVLRFDISQSYDFEPPVVNEERRHLGDVRFDLTAAPLKSVTFDADAVYDIENDRFLSTNYGFAWTAEDMANLSLERRYNRSSEIDYLEGKVSLYPGRWTVSYRGRYDLEGSQFVENRVETVYAAQCWDVTVTYIKSEDSYEYRILLNLKELGTILKL